MSSQYHFSCRKTFVMGYCSQYMNMIPYDDWSNGIKLIIHLEESGKMVLVFLFFIFFGWHTKFRAAAFIKFSQMIFKLFNLYNFNV